VVSREVATLRVMLEGMEGPCLTPPPPPTYDPSYRQHRYGWNSRWCLQMPGSQALMGRRVGRFLCGGAAA
jgi:hypothetical protein